MATQSNSLRAETRESSLAVIASAEIEAICVIWVKNVLPSKTFLTGSKKSSSAIMFECFLVKMEPLQKIKSTLEDLYMHFTDLLIHSHTLEKNGKLHSSILLA